MAITNYTAKEVSFKLVIYGPPFAGKSTAIRHLHEHIGAQTVGELATLQTAADKTLSFRFVPEDAALLDNFKIVFEVYTIPGNIVFNAPRKLVLRDADGILFLADSEWTKITANTACFKELEENLKKLGSSVDELPVALAYNKRDLADAAPASYLDFMLNNRKTRMPVFETTASTGTGIFAGLRAVAEMVIQRFLESNASAPASTEEEAISQ